MNLYCLVWCIIFHPNIFLLVLEYFLPPEIVVKEEMRIEVKEEIEMIFENNEEAGPSGIVVKEEMETDEEAGIKTIRF